MPRKPITLDDVVDLRMPMAGEPRNPARPDGKYPVTVRERALDVFSRVAVHDAVAAALNIDRGTWHEIRERNPEFAADLAAAREKARARYLLVMDRASNEDWRAAKALLQLGWSEYRDRSFFDPPLPDPNAGEGSTAITMYAISVQNNPKAIDAYHTLLQLAPAPGGAAVIGAGDPAPAAPARKKAAVRRSADGGSGGPAGVGADKPRRARTRRDGGPAGPVGTV